MFNDSEMTKTILDNLINVGWAALIFVCSYISNMAFSLYHNIKQLGQAFEYKRLINSLFKLSSLILGTVLMVVSITVLPVFANKVGWEIPDEYSSTFNNLIILGVCLYMSCKYILEAFGKFKQILGDTTTNDTKVTLTEDKVKITG